MKRPRRIAERGVPQRLTQHRVVGEPVFEKDVVRQPALAIFNQEIELAATDDFERRVVRGV